MDKLHIVIDGFEVPAEPEMTIMEAAEAADIFIPHLCHHPDLEDIGGCGLCIVEIQGEKEPQRACMTKVQPGMNITTNTEKLNALRRLSMELMLANHVDDCTTCPKYLSCELQSLIQYLEVSTSRLRRTLHSTPVDTGNPLIVRDLNRCVACARCVRVCRDVRGVGILDYRKNAFHRTFIGVSDDLKLADADCRFCGACVEVCPTGALQDQDGVFKEGNRDEVLIPCRTECPAHIDIPKYVRFIKEGNYPQAAAAIREKAPFPHTLGLVCMRFCEKGCRRDDVNGAVSIRDLKRFAAEHDDYRWKKKAFRKEPTGKRVAVVGSGPAGLTAAYYLAKLGHGVDVHEKLPVAGGMLRAGIPDYRLPRDVVENEIRIIEEFGVHIFTNAKIESLEKLHQDGYDAVLMAIGTDVGVRIPLPGADHKDVHVNIDFLRRDVLGKEMAIKTSAVVLGGGNVAFDCARTLKRLGCDRVSLACLEQADAMTADPEEIAEAREEGIHIYNSRTFLEIATAGDGVQGVRCQEVNDFSIENGKLTLDLKEDSEHLIEGQMVIFAIGQKADLHSFRELDVSPRGQLTVGKDQKTSADGVFAAGDVVTGTKSVIEAIVQGRNAAVAMDLHLGGDGVITEELSEPQPLDGYIGKVQGFAEIPRSGCRCLSVEERRDNFELMTHGLGSEDARQEAGRCLQCDLRPQLTKPKFWTEYARR